MKKITVLIFAAGSVLFSCGKSYTCDCVTTDKYDDGGTIETYTYKNSSKEYSAKMSKKQAEAACNHLEESTHSAYSNWWTDNGTSSVPDFTTSTECTLK